MLIFVVYRAGYKAAIFPIAQNFASVMVLYLGREIICGRRPICRRVWFSWQVCDGLLKAVCVTTVMPSKISRGRTPFVR
jgi:hypothetical protein